MIRKADYTEEEYMNSQYCHRVELDLAVSKYMLVLATRIARVALHRIIHRQIHPL